MKTTIAILLCITTLEVFAQSVDLSVLTRTSPVGSCNFEKCFTVEEATERAGKFSFESQEGLLDLFKARQNVKIRTGQLLPSFNLRISSPIDIFEYIPNLVGFIFPSNWFRLKESKLHSKAQEHSFIALVANQKSMAQDMFYGTHQESNARSILSNHVDFSEQLSALVKKKYELGEAVAEDVEEILAMTESLKAELVVQDNQVNASSSELSYLINQIEAGELPGPIQIEFPDLTSIKKIDAKKFIQQVLENSPELKSMDYLIAASTYGRRARYFEFLTPDSGTENAFGFGYLANVRVGVAETESLKISKKSFEANLKKAATTVASKYNTALELHQHALSIEKSLDYILGSLISDFELSSKVDINRVASLIKESLSTQQMKNNAIHGFLQAKAQLDRLLLSSSTYSAIASTVPKNTKNLDCYLRKENRQIKAAIESGTLKTREEISFESDETKFCL